MGQGEDSTVERGAPASGNESSSERLLRLLCGAEREPEVLAEIGHGGMGVVLSIRDETLGRDLAMKRIRGKGHELDPGFANDVVVRRFVDEARITAQLDHPGVVPVHRLGVDRDGRLYFTMKHVRGRGLDAIVPLVRSSTDGWNLTRAVQVFLRVCDTLAFAHARHILHRDLKPSNVMVGAFGEVYVMDWGLARRIGAAPEAVADAQTPDARTAEAETVDAVVPALAGSVTVAGAVVGTPRYMPPEQAQGRNEALDARADVYSVGAMLYELLAGAAPYAGGPKDTPAQVLRAVLTGPPRPLAEAAPDAPEELRAVAEKAMARDPGERYAGAAELRDDLQRWLEGRVVRAHRTGAVVELRKWVRRNRPLAAALAGIFVVTVGGAVAFAIAQRDAAVEITKERDRAVAETRRALGMRLSAVVPSLAEKTPSLAAAVALEGARRAPGPEARSALLAAIADDRTPLVLRGHDAYVLELDWSPDGTRIASIDTDGPECLVWDAASGTLLHRLADHRGNVLSVAFDAAGRRLATSSSDGVAKLWDPATGARIAVLAGHAGAVRAVRFAPDGLRALTTSDDGTVRLWDTATGRETARLGPTPAVRDASWSPDGARIVACGANGTLELLDAATLAPLRAYRPVDAEPGAEAITARASPRGTFVFGHVGRRLVVWETATGAEKASIADGRTLRFAPDETWAAAALEDPGGRKFAFDVAHGWTERPLPSWWDYPSHTSRSHPHHDIVLAPDGGLLAGSDNYDVVLVGPAAGLRVDRLRGHRYFVEAMVFSPDGRRLATASRDATVRVWDLAAACELRGGERLPAGLRVLRLLDDAGRALVGGEDDRCQFVDLSSGAVERDFDVGFRTSHGGRFLETSTERTRVRDLASGAVIAEFPGFASVQQSRDGRFAFGPALGAESPGWMGIDLENATATRIPAATDGRWVAGVSDDGRRISIAGAYERVALVDVPDGTLRHLDGLGGMVMRADFAPDGRRVLTYSMDGILRLFDAESRALLRVVADLPVDEFLRTSFSPDGRFVHAGPRIFKAEDLSWWATLPERAGETVLGFSGDSRRIVTLRGRTVKLWPLDPEAWYADRPAAEIDAPTRRRLKIGTDQEQAAFEAEVAARRPTFGALLRRAGLAMRAGDLAGAVRDADAAVALRPLHPLGWFGLARVHAVTAAATRDAAARDAEIERAMACLRRWAERWAAASRAELDSEADLAALREAPSYRAFAASLPER